MVSLQFIQSTCVPCLCECMLQLCRIKYNIATAHRLYSSFSECSNEISTLIGLLEVTQFEIDVIISCFDEPHYIIAVCETHSYLRKCEPSGWKRKLLFNSTE